MTLSARPWKSRAADICIAAGVDSPLPLDSHFGYLKGILSRIGLGLRTTIPAISRRGGRFRMRTAIAVIAGLGRLASRLALGRPDAPTPFVSTPEFRLAPALALWPPRVARCAIPLAAPAGRTI